MEDSRKRPRAQDDDDDAFKFLHKVAAAAALHKHKAAIAQVRHFTAVAKYESLKNELRNQEIHMQEASNKAKMLSEELDMTFRMLPDPRFAMGQGDGSYGLALSSSKTPRHLNLPNELPWRGYIRAFIAAYMENNHTAFVAWSDLEYVISRLMYCLVVSKQTSWPEFPVSWVIESLRQECHDPASPLDRMGDKAIWLADKARHLVIPPAILQSARLVLALPAQDFQVIPLATPVSSISWVAARMTGEDSCFGLKFSKAGRAAVRQGGGRPLPKRTRRHLKVLSWTSMEVLQADNYKMTPKVLFCSCRLQQT
jgi:hypothetical protein